MKSRLNEITLAQFIELLCGNYLVLSDGDEVKENELQECARSLIASYRFIADKPGMRALIADKEESVKSKMKVFFLRICNMLVLQGEFADIRSLLVMIDEDVSGVNDDNLKDRVADLLRYATFEQHRNEEVNADPEKTKEKSSPDDIRSYYDSEIAFIMTYIKMHIDMHQINAAVYANIVNQVNVDIMNKRGTFR
ncbi:hypothetical protein DW182_03255 [Bacteroides sp. AM16-24]|jgi:hypothetical protein bacD2_02000|uniref:hypothetical protein n=1 Tax=Bacteroides sp. AM16-24 TaxID=2292002 RepID=UPI000E52634A|nr:hypothetical protein [Bacteroides sp. AM16-24]RHI11531.1 hypothetical protein DW182_03255 [Bacteroides sp. AM16-24]DAK76539.1 MAG TPA: hypothetical protein [Caudoviricetes sp.]